MVWLKNDLRLVDSRSVALALSATKASDVVVVRARDGTPSHVRPTPRRLAIEREHVDAMRPVLDAAGIRLVDASETTTIVPLAVSLGARQVISNIETSEDLGFASDLRVARELRSCGIEFLETNVDRLRRGSRPAEPQFVTGARDLPPLRFDSAPEPIAALKRYLARLPYANYRRDMWTPGPDATASSRLSIDVACGALSGDRIIHETGLRHESCDPRHRQAYAQYVARLQWRQSFVQMFEDNVAAFPWGRMREERPEDAAMMATWLAGETGYPLVDAAMRDVTANGWVNFRLRQVLSSFALDLLDLDLHLGRRGARRDLRRLLSRHPLAADRPAVGNDTGPWAEGDQSDQAGPRAGPDRIVRPLGPPLAEGHPRRLRLRTLAPSLLRRATPRRRLRNRLACRSGAPGPEECEEPMIEHHHLLVTGRTFGAPINRSERVMFDENEVAADEFAGATDRVLKALHDARYSQRIENGLPSLFPMDVDLPTISFDMPSGPPWNRDLTIDMADLLVHGMRDIRRVHLGLENEGLHPDVRKACIALVARTVAGGLFDPGGNDHATTTGMRQPWADPDLQLAVDLSNAWSSPALHVMDGFHPLSTVPIPVQSDATRSVTIHVDAFETSQRAGRALWTVMPTRIFIKEDEVPQGLDLLRMLAETDR